MAVCAEIDLDPVAVDVLEGVVGDRDGRVVAVAEVDVYPVVVYI